jgi:hypothetical protein
VEQRPEFAQVVFQRRAGQAQAVPRVQLARGLGGLGPGVLDVLRLVEDQQVVLLFAELLGVARQQRIVVRIRSCSAIRAKSRRRPAPCRASTRNCGVKRSASSSQLGIRLVGITTRAGALRRPACFQEHVGQRLQRRAQAHVVGEDAAGADFAQRLHPAQAFVLVSP